MTIPLEIKIKIFKDYYSKKGNITFEKLASKWDVSLTTAYNLVNNESLKKNLEITDKIDSINFSSISASKFNVSFFDNLTKELAYILGMSHKHCNLPEINEKKNIWRNNDRDIILKIKKFIGSNHSISSHPRKKSYSLSISNSYLRNKLENLFTHNDKHKRVIPFSVLFQKEPLVNHYLRGYFEADFKVITYSSKEHLRFITFNEQTLNQIELIIFDNIDEKLRPRSIVGETNACYYIYLNKEHFPRLYDYLYIKDERCIKEKKIYIPKLKKKIEKILPERTKKFIFS